MEGTGDGHPIRSIILPTTVAAGLAFFGASLGDAERVTGYWARAEVDERGEAAIVEVIDYDFGDNDRHGITRDVPGLDPGADIRVSSPTAPADLDIERLDLDSVEVGGRPTVADGTDEVRLRIGSPASTIDGRHRYRIEYPLDVGHDGTNPVVDASSGSTVVEWWVVGQRWQVDVRDVEAHLVVPTVPTEVICRPSRCTVDVDESGRITATAEELAPGTGLVITAVLGDTAVEPGPAPAPPDGPADDPGWGRLALTALAALVAGAALIVGRGVIAFVGRDRTTDGAGGRSRRVDARHLNERVEPVPAPPDRLAPWQGGLLLDEVVTDDHCAAWLLQHAIDGTIDLDGDDRRATVTRRDVDATDDVLERFFDGDDEVRLGTYTPATARRWTAVKTELATWRRSSELWEAASVGRPNRAFLVGLLGTGVGFFGVVIAAIFAIGRGGIAGFVFLGLASLFGLGWAALTRSGSLFSRSPRGTDLWLEVEGFRRYLTTTGIRQVAGLSSDGRLPLFTAWAVALGVSTSWGRSVREAARASQASTTSTGRTDQRAYELAAIGSDLRDRGRDSTRKPSTGSSSSSGASRGGSDSGGSGGGGGSW